MPSTRRSAELGTLAAVLEDVRAIRELGGVHYATDEAFTATIAMLAPAQPITEDNRLMAQNLILTYVRRVAVVARQTAEADVCQQAAIESFETILSRPAADTQKVATIRRNAQAKYGCHLSLDGLRKREDRLLEQLASAVYEDLVASREAQGPQTVEEVARYIIDDVRDAFESIDDGLKRVYRASPMTDSQSRASIVSDMMYDIAHLQFWFGRMIGIRMRAQRQSRADLLFGDAAALVMTKAFGYYDDKVTVNRILSDVGRLDRRGFIQQVAEHADGEGIQRRFSEWVTSCHTECAYQRSYNVGLLCEPHQLAYVLFMFIDLHDDLLSGDFEDELTEDFGG